MLKAIVQHSTKLVAFLNALKLALYQPQIRHLTQILDALLVCDCEKTLTNLSHQLEEEVHPKTQLISSVKTPGSLNQYPRLASNLW